MILDFIYITGSHIDGCDSLTPSPRTGAIPPPMVPSHDAANGRWQALRPDRPFRPQPTPNSTCCNPLKPSGHYMYRQFHIQRLYVLPTQCIYVFCVDLRTNSDYFPMQH